jgi:hypothetical protein
MENPKSLLLILGLTNLGGYFKGKSYNRPMRLRSKLDEYFYCQQLLDKLKRIDEKAEREGLNTNQWQERYDIERQLE